MSKPIEISEIFMSLEGEGPHNSRPTVYIRFARCNFTCSGFNNPSNVRDANGYAPLGFSPDQYTTLSSIPTVTSGCDSQYAVNPEFAHMWEKLTIDEIADRLKELLPRGAWTHPDTGLPVILSLTGGEPMLRWKRMKELINHPFISQCKHVLVETNCSVPLSYETIGDISEWLAQDSTRRWTWSNSPKLSASGEKWDDAIKPEISSRQLMVRGREQHTQVDQYFKFVCGANQEQFDEVKRAMAAYNELVDNVQPNVWIMPEACTTEQQNDIAKEVAVMCMDQGFLFCYRLQNALWGNSIGT